MRGDGQQAFLSGSVSVWLDYCVSVRDVCAATAGIGLASDTLRGAKAVMKNSSKGQRPGIVGAAIVPHAPQFLTLPDTEDKAQVGRVNAAMRAIGDRFRALDPDLLIVLSNAHCDDFVVHCVPAFMIHCGRRAEGSGGR